MLKLGSKHQYPLQTKDHPLPTFIKLNDREVLEYYRDLYRDNRDNKKS